METMTLKEQMQARMVSPTALGKACGVSANQVSRWVAGTRKIPNLYREMVEQSIGQTPSDWYSVEYNFPHGKLSELSDTILERALVMIKTELQRRVESEEDILLQEMEKVKAKRNRIAEL